MKSITSAENPLIKTIRRLHQRKGPRQKDRFLLEGLKLGREALASGTEIETALVSKRFSRGAAGRSLLTRLEEAGVECAGVPDSLFRHLSGLESPEGVLLVAKTPSRPLAALSGELVLVIAGVSDPGNAGTMARVAEAAGADGLVKCRGSVDLFQPKALRASMGSLLRLPVFDAGPPEETLPSLKSQGFTLAVCLPRGGRDFREALLTGPLALVVGNESAGIPERILGLSDIRVSVPMKEPVESLNVAFVSGLVLYEAARQRGTI